MDEQDRARASNRIAELRRELGSLEAEVSAPARDGMLTAGGYARALLAGRAALARYFDPALFGDPALEILLFLFAEGREATTTACCAATHAPRTTALRYIRILATRGLLVSSDDDLDRRMTLLRLSDAARDGMESWLRQASPTELAT